MVAAVMKANARFDPDTLRKLAGAKVFGRGEDYYRDGSVEILSLTAKRVVAQVEGTEDYRAVLTGRGTEIGGECSCPAFMEWRFCKHLVATALAANALGDDAEAEAAGALSRIRQYLKSKGVDGLVDMILDRAEQDPELFRKLDMESTLVRGDDKTLEARLRKAIDGATRTGTFVDYREAPAWRSRVEEVLDAVEDIASGPRADIAVKLIEHAIERIEATFEAIDGSDGHLGELLQYARDIHVAATRAVGPDPVALARNLFKRETSSDFETFAGAAADYADVLGEQGLAEYRRLATAEWDKLPGHSGRTRAAADDSGSVHQLKRILDFFAEREGDVEFRIALRTRDLSSPWAYLQLAEFCMSQGREVEALRRAEEGLWLFEDRRPDGRLLSFAVRLLNKAGRKADAEAHLWRAFQKEPSLGVYEELRKIGGEPAVGRALAILESRLSNNQRSSWRDGPDLLLKILIREERFDLAWSTVHKFGVSMHARQALVEATDVRYPREALEFYTAQVEQLASTGIYEEVAKLIARMAKLRSTTEQAAFVADLKARHGRKRNLMKLLG
jgi:uncharacterized Zn finger protein